MSPTDFAQAMIDPIVEFVNALKYIIEMASKARKKTEGWDWQIIITQWQQFLSQ